MLNYFLKAAKGSAAGVLAITMAIGAPSVAQAEMGMPFGPDGGAVTLLIHNPMDPDMIELANWWDRPLQWGAQSARQTLPGRIGIGLGWPRRACAPSSFGDIANC